MQNTQNQGGRILLSLEQIASVSVAAAAFIRATFHRARIEVCALAFQASEDCRGFAPTAHDEARRAAAVGKLPIVHHLTRAHQACHGAS